MAIREGKKPPGNARGLSAFCLFLGAGFLPAFSAWGQADAGERLGPRRGVSVGARAAYYRPKGADRGDLAEGAQARLHFGPRWALEGSVDLRHDRFDGTNVDLIPVQLSLMAYVLPPGYRAAPYLLAGGGWYYAHIRAPVDRFESRFGPHAGTGLEFFLTESWSLDGSYRYLWTEDIHSQDVEHPLGRNFSGKAFMLTGALNYSF